MNDPAIAPAAPDADALDELKTREQLLDQVRALRLQVAVLTQTLQDRKEIERAKGAIMRRMGLSEEEAHRRLRLLSSSLNVKLVEVARRVLEAEEVFRALESGDGGRRRPAS